MVLLDGPTRKVKPVLCPRPFCGGSIVVDRDAWAGTVHRCLSCGRVVEVVANEARKAGRRRKRGV